MNTVKHKLLLGLIPTRRDLDGEFFCNSTVAQQRKVAIEKKLNEMQIDYVNLDFLNKEGIIISGLDAQKVADYMTAKGVDALFCPHVNFGTEDAIAKIGKLMKKPLLLWGPRDEAPDADGNRCTDSQCGLFATGKVLRQFGVPFTYMTNCTITDPTFDRVFYNFLAAAQIVKSFYHMRIGQFGVRPETFWSVKCNEMQLLEQFGVEVVPTTMIELENMYHDTLKNKKHKLTDYIKQCKETFDVHIDEESLLRTAAMNRTIRWWADEHNIDAIASNCWGAMRQIGGISSCFTFSELTEEKLPVVCETDINGAISSVIAQASTRWQKSSFLADITMRHPTNNNAELLWHCGVFPRSTALETAKPAIGFSFDEGRPSVGSFQMKGGEITICRFDSTGDQYQLMMAEGTGVDGPPTKGTYGWFEFKDLPALEHKIVYGPYIHHCAGTYNNSSAAMYEACKYIPGLAPDPTSPSKMEIESFLR